MLQEFCLDYQPIVDLSTGKLSGFEALVRWHHASGVTYPPAEFIPVAEETGLINDLGWWVLQEASHQISLWQQQFPQIFPLTINVNLSAVQLKQPNLLNRIEEILQQTGIPRDLLKLEITESCF